MADSRAYEFAQLPAEVQAELMKEFTDEEKENLLYDADFWLRPEQKIPEGPWFITALVAGRGFGKTRTAAEWVRKKALSHPGCIIAVAGRTAADVRNTMVLGESGILAVHAPHERPVYKQHTASLQWPNGSKALLLTSEAPDGARGPQFHYAVGDEFAAWKTTVDASGATLYTNLIAATRLPVGRYGTNPQILLATTPKRTSVMKDLMDRAKDPKEKIIVIGGSTRDNKNLQKEVLENMYRQYGNSDLAKQEIEGLMLDDAEGLVFTSEMINKSKYDGEIPGNITKIIAVDPTVSGDTRRADECGIMVMAATNTSNIFKRKAYVLEDATIRATPDVWAAQVVKKAKEHGIKNIVCEANQGGQLLQMVINTLDPTLKIYLVHASKGKVTRTEPVVVAMQQGRVRFTDDFPELVDQLQFYDPDNSGYSPDRMDAFVWGAVALLVAPPKGMSFGGFRAASATGRRIPVGNPGTGRTRTRSSMARR